jgi:hypothetical protein
MSHASQHSAATQRESHKSLCSAVDIRNSNAVVPDSRMTVETHANSSSLPIFFYARSQNSNYLRPPKSGGEKRPNSEGMQGVSMLKVIQTRK